MKNRSKVTLLSALLLVAALAVFLRPETHAGGPPSSATSVTPELRKELLAVRESVWRAWFANDQAALAKLLPQDLIAINNGQADWDDLAKTLSGAQEFAGKNGRLISLNFPKTELQVYGNVAILYSQFEVEASSGGTTQKQSGRATEIFLRQNGRWINTGWHLDSGK